jgi:hypothetical protein
LDLFDTGVDGNKTPLPYGTIDPHYFIVSPPIPLDTPPGPFPRTTTAANHPWPPVDPSTRWIGEANGYVASYYYQTSFDLTGCQESDTIVDFKANVDNVLMDVIMNTTRLGIFINVNSTTTYRIQTGFISGINKLTFWVYNSGGWVGLDVKFTSATTKKKIYY